MEAPGALEVTRVPSVIVPVCVDETPCVSATPCVSGVVTSVPECVLPSTPCVKGAPQAEETTCAQVNNVQFTNCTGKVEICVPRRP